VSKNSDLVKNKGAETAFKILMGMLMRKYRGKVKAEKASELLRVKLKRQI